MEQVWTELLTEKQINDKLTALYKSYQKLSATRNHVISTQQLNSLADDLEFQQQLITIDSERSKSRFQREDEELLQWYLDQPNLFCDETSDTEDE